jgi:hypothetical protein
MSHTRSEMIGMISRKFPGSRNTSYYGVQVAHCVRRLREYCKSSKTTKYALRAVACISTLWMLSHVILQDMWGTHFSDGLNEQHVVRHTCQMDDSSGSTSSKPVDPKESGFRAVGCHYLKIPKNSKMRNRLLFQSWIWSHKNWTISTSRSADI